MKQDGVDLKELAMSTLGWMKEANTVITRLEKENSNLVTQMSESKGDSVVLEKFASTPALEDHKLNETLSKLTDLNIVPEHLREKLATDIQDDPNTLLKLIDRMTEVSEYDEGSAVTRSHELKQASSDDEDGWL